MASPTPKNVVLFGGTGTQGSAFARALAAYNVPSVQYHIFVLSRSPTSGASTRLAALPGVRIVPSAQDYADKPLQALEGTGLQRGEVHGVFDVQGYMGEEEDEAQAKGIVDAAVTYGVKHFIYASVDHDDTVQNGGDSLDPKRHTEKYLRALNVPYTALRSTDFMDNWLPKPTFQMKAYRTILLRRTFRRDPGTKLQLISTWDVGRAGALALHEGDRWIGKAMRLSGDRRSMDEVRGLYRKVFGEEVQETYSLLAAVAKWAVPSAGRLSKFHNEKSYTIPEGTTQAFLPDVEDFEAFLTRSKRERDGQ